MSLLADNVCLRLGSKNVLDDVTCQVIPGKTTAIVGANGSGKSSLLKTLSGEYSPDRGSVILDDIELSDLSALEQARRRALMSQNPSVTFDFLVSEIIEMGWVQNDLPIRTFNESVNEVSTLCSIDRFMERRLHSLSGGERQRIHFARTLLQIWNITNDNRPRYLLLDEPTSNLDIVYQLELLKLAKYMSAKSVGVLIVLHDLNLAARFADYIYLLVSGRVFSEGEVSEVYTEKILSEAYEVPLLVERHKSTNRLMVFVD